MAVRSRIVNFVQVRFFYGWVVLATATVMMFASGPGQSHTFSIFVDLIAQDLGISNTAVASSYAFATLLAAFFLSPLGRMVDRFGVRRTMLVVSILLGAACFAFGNVIGAATLSLGFMALRFLGQGSMMLGSANFVAQWFDRKRGFAMSIMMLGFSASIALHPILAQWLIDQVGWRQAWYWLGVMTWVGLLPLIWFLAHDKPEILGLRPDGTGAKSDDHDGLRNPTDQDQGNTAQLGLDLRRAVRLPAFWIIAAGLFTPAMLCTSLFFFQVSIFEAHGLSRTLAASMFSVSAISMAIAMPVVGWLLDRSDAKFVFAGALLLLACTLMAVTFVSDAVTAVIFAVVFGFNNAANMTFFGFMWAHYFGRRHLGSIQGAGQTIGVIGASLGPLPLGIAYDLAGSYDGVLRLLALLPVACAVLALFLRRPDLTSMKTAP